MNCKVQSLAVCTTFRKLYQVEAKAMHIVGSLAPIPSLWVVSACETVWANQCVS